MLISCANPKQWHFTHSERSNGERERERERAIEQNLYIIFISARSEVQSEFPHTLRERHSLETNNTTILSLLLSLFALC